MERSLKKPFGIFVVTSLVATVAMADMYYDPPGDIATGNAISILDLANMMIDASGLKIKPIFADPLEGDIEKSLADISQAKNYFKWEPKTKLNNWLTEILKK